MLDSHSYFLDNFSNKFVKSTNRKMIEFECDNGGFAAKDHPCDVVCYPGKSIHSSLATIRSNPLFIHFALFLVPRINFSEDTEER